MENAFNAMAVGVEGVKRLPVPAPECLVYLLQMSGVDGEGNLLQERVLALYEGLKWEKNRALSWDDLQVALKHALKKEPIQLEHIPIDEVQVSLAPAVSALVQAVSALVQEQTYIARCERPPSKS